MPLASSAGLTGPPARAIALKVRNMPVTVPNRPIIGAMAAISDSQPIFWNSLTDSSVCISRSDACMVSNEWPSFERPAPTTFVR